ncbi:DUF3492 domain-containing protein [Streptomyces sp. NPDC056347]|uniref:DUF3492 domain-containing protein n=1 Tax=Streptomyces sp. NPDC056347 TaxID=3345790 RepID=UPI0035DA871E
MRIGLLTDGGYPYATGGSGLWCDRLVRGLPQHEFDLFALVRSVEQEARGRLPLPAHVRRMRTAPLWSADEYLPGPRSPKGLFARMATGTAARPYGRRERQWFTNRLADLAASVCAAGGEDETVVRSPADTDPRFTDGLYGLAELAREYGGLAAALRSESAVQVLEAACRARGTGRTVQRATVPDLLAFAQELGRALRPLSLDWYDEEGLGAVDLCHAASGGAAALPGLLAKHFFRTPLLVTEGGVRLREHYLAASGTPLNAPARALLASFHGRLVTEVYRQATIVTAGNTHARRWQERCGADRAKLRTVRPGMERDGFTALGESGDCGPDNTLVWVGRIEPAKDLVTLLRAFALVREAEPGARLRIISTTGALNAAEALGAPGTSGTPGLPAAGPEDGGHLAHCEALAARLFPGAASPVSFEELGGARVPELPDAYAAGGVVVLSGVAEGFPAGLVASMFCGRATVSTDAGAVVETIGGTGLVVPPRNPGALADACLALLRDPERRARLGAAARARALELFTVEQNLAAFHGLYLELIARAPVRGQAATEDADGGPRPFATPPEAHVLDAWPAPDAVRSAACRTPSWAAARRGVCAGSRGAGGRDV